ncbi:MAG TPA: hypothetical protein VGO62_15450 [Myxococcota bacterium]|jgi:hypothetical protein
MKKQFPVIAAFVLGALMTAGVATAANQPNMQDALTALNTAKTSLDKAEADKGGHRAKALEAVKTAITEVQAGIDFAAKGK